METSGAILQANVDQSLYGAQDRFSWSGGYNDTARALAGTELHDWVERNNLGGLDLYPHSHGGSVAMLANQAGADVGRMVLLSCPVHWPKYAPDFNHTQKVVSIRVHLDLVILADGGAAVRRSEDRRERVADLVRPFRHARSRELAEVQHPGDAVAGAKPGPCGSSTPPDCLLRTSCGERLVRRLRLARW
jgi:hypothetical protein